MLAGFGSMTLPSDRRMRLRLGSGLKANSEPWNNSSVAKPMFEN
jgi:hypothetical protein